MAGFALAARIAFVNEHAVEIPEKRCEAGTWVELDGAFVSTALEDTEGYALRVNGARTMTCQEYLDAYAPDAAEAASPDGQVVVLDIDVRNEGSMEGYINYKSWRLLPPGRNTVYYVDGSLWTQAIPALAEGMGAFGVVEGTTKNLQIPFWHQDVYGMSVGVSSGGPTVGFYAPVASGRYDFVFAHIPRHVMPIDL